MNDKRKITNGRPLLCIVVVLMLLALTTPVAAKFSTSFSQCADDTYPPGNVLLNYASDKSNSVYYEGMSLPQRLIFTDIPVTTDNKHSLKIETDCTKAGIHAYDFIVSAIRGMFRQ